MRRLYRIVDASGGSNIEDKRKEAGTLDLQDVGEIHRLFFTA